MAYPDPPAGPDDDYHNYSNDEQQFEQQDMQYDLELDPDDYDADFGEQTIVDFPMDRSADSPLTYQDIDGYGEDYEEYDDGFNEADIQPTLWIVSDRAVSSLSYSPEQVCVSVGNSQEDVDVYINDPAIAKKQLVITRIGREWLFVDRGVKDLCHFDGVQTRQMVAPWNCRTVISMGDSRLVFTGVESTNFMDASQVAPKRRRLETVYDPPDVDSQVYISNDKMTVDAAQEPLLIGSHMVCDFIIPEKTVRPFHAMVFWAPDGVYIEPMGNFKLQVSGQMTTEPFRLQPDDEIIIGSEMLRVELYGDHQARCAQLFEDGLDFENFCLTPLGGVASEPFIIPAYGGAITIGRSSTCGITLNDMGVSRAHAQIIPSGKSFHLIDNYSANGTYVNNEKISKARVHAGDVIEIGKTFFVVHYS